MCGVVMVCLTNHLLCIIFCSETGHDIEFKCRGSLPLLSVFCVKARIGGLKGDRRRPKLIGPSIFICFVLTEEKIARLPRNTAGQDNEHVRVDGSIS